MKLLRNMTGPIAELDTHINMYARGVYLMEVSLFHQK